MKVSFLINGEKKDKFEIKKKSLNAHEIIKKLSKKQVYFSELCKSHNLCFKVDGKELPQRRNPFSDVKKGSKISIELYGDFITLNYCEMLFNFTENEPITEVINTIKAIFYDSSSVSIYFDQNHEYTAEAKLQKNFLNKIEIQYKLKFVRKEYNTKNILCMDYTSTVSDAKNGLSIILSDEKKKMIVKPENIELKNHKNKTIFNQNTLLRDVQKLRKKFYYKYSFTYVDNYNQIPKTPRRETNRQQINAQRKETINLQEKNEANKQKAYKETNRQKTSSKLDSSKKQKEVDDKDCMKIVLINDNFYPIQKNVHLSTKIDDVKKMIADEKGFKKDEVLIMYEKNNKKVELDSDETIEDILDLIKIKVGKSKQINLLHFEISKNQRNLKIKQEKDDEEDEEEGNEEEEIKTLNKSKKKPISLFRPKVSPVNKSSDKLLTKKKANAKMIKYIYQTNLDPEDQEIELEEEATVKNMKEEIGKEKGIENIYDIKIIFSGKELLNELILKELNIGDIKLFLYIRTQEDILLMTAKALQMNEYSSTDSSSMIEEEEEDNNDDDDDDDDDD